MKVEVLNRQSIIDLAIQHTGDVANAFAIALANSVSITDELAAGSDIEIPEAGHERDILNYYTLKKIQPATAITKMPGVEPQPEGIGYWIINRNFKVS